MKWGASGISTSYAKLSVCRLSLFLQVYQDWLKAPEYPGKSENDIEKWTVKDFSGVIEKLQTM
jgi:hypothetical protein